MVLFWVEKGLSNIITLFSSQCRRAGEAPKNPNDDHADQKVWQTGIIFGNQMHRWTKRQHAMLENNPGSNEISSVGKRKILWPYPGPLKFPLALSRYHHPVNEKKLALTVNLLELLTP